MAYNFNPAAALASGRSVYQDRRDAEQKRKMNEQLFDERKRASQGKRMFKEVSLLNQYVKTGNDKGIRRSISAMGDISPELKQNSDLMMEQYNAGGVKAITPGVGSLFNQGIEMGAIKERKKSGRDSLVGKISFKDATFASIAKYEKSGDPNDLVRFKPKIHTIEGTKYGWNDVAQKYEPIIDVTSKAVSEQITGISKHKADRKSRLDFAESKTKWQTGMPKFRSKISSTADSQKILVATANRIKERISGWSTEWGASLSKIPTTDAKELKNLLDTLKAHSAFSTLTELKASGGTLGAISEAELLLLKAKLGSLDQYGNGDELIRVVDQIVNSNGLSIGRLETEFGNTNNMYSGSFDDFQTSQQTKQQGQLPQGVTEDDITTTMQVHGMTREQVLSRLGGG